MTSNLKKDEIDDEISEDTDWLRPGGSGDTDDDNYEDMFNQDIMQNYTRQSKGLRTQKLFNITQVEYQVNIENL